jgi:hypothetical protein
MSIDVSSARIGLPFLTKRRTSFLDGTKTPRLERHLVEAFVTVTPDVVRASTTNFRVPDKLR